MGEQMGEQTAILKYRTYIPCGFQAIIQEIIDLPKSVFQENGGDFGNPAAPRQFSPGRT